MTSFPFTPLVQSLPATIPFIGPETLERSIGRVFEARVGANESAFGISPRARGAMVDAVAGVGWYNDPENYDLRMALAQLYNLPVDHISVGAGIDDLLGSAVRAFLEPGQVTVASAGSYPTYHYHVAGFDAVSHGVPYHKNRNALEGLVDAVHKTGSHLVYLANPDNPTGTWHTAAALQAFLDALPTDCICILDEAYFEFAPGDSILPMRPHDPRVIRMRTFSKAHGMAGARIGYAIAHPEIVSAFDKVRLHFNVNRIAQIGALASLGDEAFIRFVVREVDKGRAEYAQLGRELGLPTVPSATNFVAFDCETSERAQKILEGLIAGGVFVRKPAVPPLNRLVRITVGSSKERAVVAEVLRAVCRQ
ncbi:MAG: aminotransferase class I/II-fold pyridoxal phosphate-dependent enzyme [bacterium]|nr:aminotransferase class I/II-fold pyridoxal phosphate-dependent enzyme [bacterium]